VRAATAEEKGASALLVSLLGRLARRNDQRQQLRPSYRRRQRARAQANRGSTPST